jgi:hypothetical protein
VLGFSREEHDFCVTTRLSWYMVGVNKDGVRDWFDESYTAASVFFGNSAQSARTHLSGGFRTNTWGIGPVLLLDHSLGPASLRLEGSYMVAILNRLLADPLGVDKVPPMLTLGLTIAGPAPPAPGDSGTKDH